MIKGTAGKRILPVLLGLMLLLSGVVAQAEERYAGDEDSAGTEEDASSIEEDVYNILLIGSDRRDDSWNGNSDVMILVTVNDSTESIVMTSFMRDLYADIPGYGVHKLNYAYAAGGADKLVETLEDNYDIGIDNYAAVDFDGMAEIIDLIGGVDMELSDAEVGVMNTYLNAMGQSDQCLYAGGFYHLSGYQAVAHMRDRYVGNSDYERTERQRNVLSEIFHSLQDLDAAELTDLAQEALDLTEHDISVLDLIRLLAELPDMMDYSLVENRVPYDGLYTSQDEMLIPDFDATIERLHEIMYLGE